MKKSDEFYNILFVVHQLNTDILKKIDDYERLIKDSETVKENFYNIEFVYMHSIILDLAKLTSSTKSDKSGIKDLKRMSPHSIKEKITTLLNDYSDLLEKIRINRNKIIAHTDVSEKGSYMKMGFSEVEVERKINDYIEYLKLKYIAPTQKDLDTITQFQKMKAASSDNERYSPSDFSLDLPKIKEMLSRIIDIVNELNNHLYTNK